ncbi:Transposase DDE domain protein [Caballeronia arationis]|uniref:IS5 family transposase n=1 Tax=Caballeronia arationis TaxID=1777142 RepID=UPI00074C49A8|nr:IS5 family transposase [Caballeronia arationis]SAL06484.1 Transposase DDE domain protein [Caballeronia arationis]
MAGNHGWQTIPTKLGVAQFEQFVLPHLSRGRRGPPPTLSLHKLFNYILQALYMGCQWKMLPIGTNAKGLPEIHYTRIYRAFRRWQTAGCMDAIFAGSVSRLHEDQLLDLTVIHGDGTTTAAKKGGDNLGYSGHKHLKGDKVVALCDRHCNVIAPFVTAPGNRNESPLLRDALPRLSQIARVIGMDLQGAIVSLDGVYDCRTNRKAIFNRGMVPNIPENPRGRKTSKRGRKRHFDAGIFEERFRTIERVFAWEDKFRRLLLRFERISDVHYAFKTLAYTLINLRHYCRN